jgi:hypothetical protein
MEGGAVGHRFERDPPRGHPCQVWLIWFSGFREEDLNVIFYQNMPNLHNRYHIFRFFLAHLAFRPGELLSSFFVRRPSVHISHVNLLLRNH